MVLDLGDGKEETTWCPCAFWTRHPSSNFVQVAKGAFSSSQREIVGPNLSKDKSFFMHSRLCSRTQGWISASESSGPRIHVLEIPETFKPKSAPSRYPSYAKDFGVEQDFHLFLINEYRGRVGSPEVADFLYLPIYWTRFYLTNGVAKAVTSGVNRLVDSFAHLSIPIFTVCQWDDGTLMSKPVMIEYLASRKGSRGFDAPLLASALPKPLFTSSLKKRHLANFIGRTETHPIREELQISVEGISNILFDPTPRDARRFSRILLESSITLCPRGHGGSSFRFWEAIQMGSIPWLIGDIDTRPFKGIVEWDRCSFYSPDVPSFLAQLESLCEQEVSEKREYLASFVAPRFTWGNWCTLLVEELGGLTHPGGVLHS